MVWELETFIISSKHRGGVAPFVQELLMSYPERHMLITITRPVKSEEFSVAIATTELSDDTETQPSSEEQQTT